jgi:DNA-binding GntR family transcriptional regulator
MTKIFEKQEKTTLKSSALKEIKRAILSGKLKPGDRLVETQLAKDMGISKFPIREAIGQLERLGFVSTVPYKGSCVSTFSERDMEELYTLRSALESLAVRILMSKLNEVTIEKLISIVEKMQKAADKEKLEEVINEDIRFHQTICELSGHRKLLEMWMMLQDQIKYFITMEEYFNDQSNVLVEPHYRILEALKGGDNQLLEKSINDHLMLGLSIVKNMYQKKPAPLKEEYSQ